MHSSAYPHLKTILIEEFKNSTVQYGLEEEFSNKLTDYFNADGRLKVVNINSDSILSGEILDYENKIFSYDENGIEEYKVSILFKITFSDLKRNEVIWQKDNLVLNETWSASGEFTEFKSEEETQQQIIQDLFDQILKNSLEQW
ncbi:MAG: hypothetical protein K8S23_02625 [Candidatus Cloacimonetes bacterium]|nr:hypothetical protein [Candidatus Cloacimonadota bacterium]